MKNTQLKTLVRSLKRLGIEHESKLWKRVASDLEKPTRIRRMINVYKIDQHAKEGDVVIVPGKVLGDGEITKNITIAAYQFSELARAKLSEKGTVLTIAELMHEHPQGKKIKILG